MTFEVMEAHHSAHIFQSGKKIIMRESLKATLRAVGENSVMLEDGSSLGDWRVHLYIDANQKSAADLKDDLRDTDVGCMRYLGRDPGYEPQLSVGIAWFDGSISKLVQVGARVCLLATEQYLHGINLDSMARQCTIKPGDVIPLCGISVQLGHTDDVVCRKLPPSA